MEFTTTEQSMLEEMGAAAHGDRPAAVHAVVPVHGARAGGAAPDRRLAQGVDEARGPTKGYHAAERVSAHSKEGNDWTAVHEADGGLPICNLRKHFERMAVEDPTYEIVELGPGLVNCGHCANRQS